MDIIKIKNLSHKYDKKQIYENLNLNIKEGSIFGLLGKNGVGKSTLINILMGYIKPNAGECLIFNEHSHNLSKNIKEDIALLYEGFITYDYMSIEEIEKFFAPFYKRWRRELFYELVDLMNLEYSQKLSSLSFGQKSQVVLGTLFAQDAKLLILDDYSMGLDAGYRRLFVDYLKEYVKSGLKTVLITSHVMQDLDGLIDEMAIIRRGGEIYSNRVKNFRDTFNCYEVTKDEKMSIEEKYIHRVEEYKDKNLIYSFHNLNLKEIETNFEDKFLGFVGRY